MSCKECAAPVTQTPEETEVCTMCGLLQEALFPIICMEVERYISARAEYQSYDDDYNLESISASYIGATKNENNQIFDSSTLMNQRKQQNSTNSARVSRFISILKAICYKHFNESVSNEAIKIFKQKEKEKQWGKYNKYHIFGACIYLALQGLSRPASFSEIASAVNNSANRQITSFNDIGKLVNKVSISFPVEARYIHAPNMCYLLYFPIAFLLLALNIEYQLPPYLYQIHL